MADEELPPGRTLSIFGKKCPKSDVIFWVQVVLIYIVVVVSLVHLTLDTGERGLWKSLLGSALIRNFTGFRK